MSDLVFWILFIVCWAAIVAALLVAHHRFQERRRRQACWENVRSAAQQYREENDPYGALRKR